MSFTKILLDLNHVSNTNKFFQKFNFTCLPAVEIFKYEWTRQGGMQGQGLVMDLFVINFTVTGVPERRRYKFHQTA